MAETNEALERAKVAQTLAGNANTVVQAYGFLFEALLGTMKDNNLISPSQIKTVFYRAATMVDEIRPQNPLQETVCRGMREVISRVAKGSGIEVPPPGQTGMQRKQGG